MFLCNRKPDHQTEHFFVPERDKCNAPLSSNPLISIRLQQVCLPTYCILIYSSYILPSFYCMVLACDICTENVGVSPPPRYEFHICSEIFIEYGYVLQLSNTLFEELVMDVFDEVDRRENEASQ